LHFGSRGQLSTLGDVAGPREEHIEKTHLARLFSLGNTYLGSSRESLVVASPNGDHAPGRSDLLNTEPLQNAHRFANCAVLLNFPLDMRTRAIPVMVTASPVTEFKARTQWEKTLRHLLPKRKVHTYFYTKRDAEREMLCSVENISP